MSNETQALRSMGASGVPDDSYGVALPLRFHRVTQTLNAVGTIWIISMMLFINADVMGREVFDIPLRGVTEFVAISITGIVFLQLADTFVSGRMTRADLLLMKISRTSPRLSALLHAVYHTLCAALVVVILWASWQPFLESIQIQEYVGSLGDFTMPVWPVRLVMVAGMLATIVACLLLAWTDLRRLKLLGD